MLSAYMKGLIGRFLQGFGALIFVMIAANGGSILTALIVAAVLGAAGSYLVFVARHTVRLTQN